MKIDITLKITPKMVMNAQSNEKKSLVGHLGTHFDVMNKEFPLEYTQRKGIAIALFIVSDEVVPLPILFIGDDTWKLINLEFLVCRRL